MQEELAEQVSQVLAAWQQLGLVDESASVRDVSRLARIAVLTVTGHPVECGAEHPDRNSIRCTAECGHSQEYHRNSTLRIEWQVKFGDEVLTWVDGLGRLVFPPLTGRYLPLPPEGSKLCSQFVRPEGSLCTLPLGHEGTCGGTPDDNGSAAGSPEVLVYRALIPILDRAGEKLRRLQRSYKGAATRGVEQAARDCERAVQQLEKLVDPYEVTDGDSDA